MGDLDELIVPKALKTCPKSNKSPNLVTLTVLLHYSGSKLRPIHWSQTLCYKIKKWNAILTSTLRYLLVMLLLQWFHLCISLSKIGLSRPRFRLFNTVASIILPMTRFEWPTSSERSNHHTNCPLGYQIDDDVDKCDVIRFDVEERRFNVVDEDDVVEENGLKGRHVLCWTFFPEIYFVHNNELGQQMIISANQKKKNYTTNLICLPIYDPISCSTI